MVITSDALKFNDNVGGIEKIIANKKGFSRGNLRGRECWDFFKLVITFFGSTVVGCGESRFKLLQLLNSPSRLSRQIKTSETQRSRGWSLGSKKQKEEK